LRCCVDPRGATVDEVAGTTGWQRHTVRGVLSGTLKKKLGLTLASAKEERVKSLDEDYLILRSDDGKGSYGQKLVTA
jgi:hypothetical protein